MPRMHCHAVALYLYVFNVPTGLCSLILLYMRVLRKTRCDIHEFVGCVPSGTGINAAEVVLKLFVAVTGGAFASASSTIGGWFSSIRTSKPATGTSSLDLSTASTPDGDAPPLKTSQKAKLRFSRSGADGDTTDDDDDFEMAHGRSRFIALAPSSVDEYPASS